MCIRDSTRYKASRGEDIQTDTEINAEIQETQPTSEMEVATNNNVETRQEGTPSAEPDQPRWPEGLTPPGDTNILEMMTESLNKNMESIHQKMDDSQKSNESLNKKIRQ